MSFTNLQHMLRGHGAKYSVVTSTSVEFVVGYQLLHLAKRPDLEGKA